MSYLTEDEAKKADALIKFGEQEDKPNKKKELLSTISSVYVDLQKTDEEIESMNKNLFQYLNTMIDTQKRIASEEDSVSSVKDNDNFQNLPKADASYSGDRILQNTVRKSETSFKYFRPFIDSDSLLSDSSTHQEKNLEEAYKTFSQSLFAQGVNISNEEHKLPIVSSSVNFCYKNDSSDIGRDFAENRVLVHSTSETHLNKKDNAEIRKVYIREDTCSVHQNQHLPSLAFSVDSYKQSPDVKCTKLDEDIDGVPMDSDQSLDAISDTSVSSECTKTSKPVNVSEPPCEYTYYYQQGEGLVYDYSKHPQLQYQPQRNDKDECRDATDECRDTVPQKKIDYESTKSKEHHSSSKNTKLVNKHVADDSAKLSEKSSRKEIVKDTQNIIKRYDEYKKNIVSDVDNKSVDSSLVTDKGITEKECTNVNETADDNNRSAKVVTRARMTYGEYKRSISSDKKSESRELSKVTEPTSKMKSINSQDKLSKENVSDSKTNTNPTLSSLNKDCTVENNPSKLTNVHTTEKEKMKDIRDKKIYSKSGTGNRHVKRETNESDKKSEITPSREHSPFKSDFSKVGREKCDSSGRRWDPTKSRYGRRPGKDNELIHEPINNPFSPFCPNKSFDKPSKINTGKERDPAENLLAIFKVWGKDNESKDRKSDISKVSATSTQNIKLKGKSTSKSFRNKAERKAFVDVKVDVVSEAVVSSTIDDEVDSNKMITVDIASEENKSSLVSTENKIVLTPSIKSEKDNDVIDVDPSVVEQNSNPAEITSLHVEILNNDEIPNDKSLDKAEDDCEKLKQVCEPSEVSGAANNITEQSIDKSVLLPSGVSDAANNITDQSIDKSVLLPSGVSDAANNTTDQSIDKSVLLPSGVSDAVNSIADQSIDKSVLLPSGVSDAVNNITDQSIDKTVLLVHEDLSVESSDAMLANKDSTKTNLTEEKDKVPDAIFDRKSPECNETVPEGSNIENGTCEQPFENVKCRICEVKVVDIFWKAKANGKFKKLKISHLIRKFMKKFQRLEKQRLQKDKYVQNPSKKESNFPLSEETDVSLVHSTAEDYPTGNEFDAKVSSNNITGKKKRKRILCFDSEDETTPDAEYNMPSPASTECSQQTSSEHKSADSLPSNNDNIVPVTFCLGEEKCEATSESMKSDHTLTNIQEVAKSSDDLIQKQGRTDTDSVTEDLIVSRDDSAVKNVSCDITDYSEAPFENKTEIVNDTKHHIFLKQNEDFCVNEDASYINNLNKQTAQTNSDIISETSVGISLVEKTFETKENISKFNIDKPDTIQESNNILLEGTTCVAPEVSNLDKPSTDLDQVEEGHACTENDHSITNTSPLNAVKQIVECDSSSTFDESANSKYLVGAMSEENHHKFISDNIDDFNSSKLFNISTTLNESKGNLSMPLPVIDNLSSEIDKSLLEVEKIPNTLLEDSSDDSENDMPFIKNLNSFLTDLSKIGGKADEVSSSSNGLCDKTINSLPSNLTNFVEDNVEKPHCKDTHALVYDSFNKDIPKDLIQIDLDKEEVIHSKSAEQSSTDTSTDFKDQIESVKSTDKSTIIEKATDNLKTSLKRIHKEISKSYNDDDVKETNISCETIKNSKNYSETIQTNEEKCQIKVSDESIETEKLPKKILDSRTEVNELKEDVEVNELCMLKKGKKSNKPSKKTVKNRSSSKKVKSVDSEVAIDKQIQQTGNDADSNRNAKRKKTNDNSPKLVSKKNKRFDKDEYFSELEEKCDSKNNKKPYFNDESFVDYGKDELSSTDDSTTGSLKKKVKRNLDKKSSTLQKKRNIKKTLSGNSSIINEEENKSIIDQNKRKLILDSGSSSEDDFKTNQNKTNISIPLKKSVMKYNVDSDVDTDVIDSSSVDSNLVEKIDTNITSQSQPETKEIMEDDNSLPSKSNKSSKKLLKHKSGKVSNIDNSSLRKKKDIKKKIDISKSSSFCKFNEEILDNKKDFFTCIYCKKEYCYDIVKGKQFKNYSKNILSFCTVCYIKVYKQRFLSFKKKFNSKRKKQKSS